MRAVKFLFVYLNSHTFVLSSIFEVIFLSLSPSFSDTTATSLGASVLSASSCFAEVLVSEKLLEHVITSVRKMNGNCK